MQNRALVADRPRIRAPAGSNGAKVVGGAAEYRRPRLAVEMDQAPLVAGGPNVIPAGAVNCTIGARDGAVWMWRDGMAIEVIQPSPAPSLARAEALVARAGRDPYVVRGAGPQRAGAGLEVRGKVSLAPPGSLPKLEASSVGGEDRQTGSRPRRAHLERSSLVERPFLVLNVPPFAACQLRRIAMATHQVPGLSVAEHPASRCHGVVAPPIRWRRSPFSPSLPPSQTNHDTGVFSIPIRRAASGQ